MQSTMTMVSTNQIPFPYCEPTTRRRFVAGVRKILYVWTLRTGVTFLLALALISGMRKSQPDRRRRTRRTSQLIANEKQQAIKNSSII